MGNHDALHIDAHRFAPAAPDEEYVFGSCCPGWHSAGEHETCIDQWITDMQDAGIERVCCLLPGQQLDDNQANLPRYEAVFGAENVLHAGAADHRLLDPAVLDQEILPFLDEAVAADERVVVHCLAGIGRTGQVLAAWLVYDRGYSPTTAIETVSELGRDPMEPVRKGNATEAELHDLLTYVGNG